MVHLHVNVQWDILVMDSHVTMLMNVTLHHVTLMPHVLTMMVVTHALVMMDTKVTVKHASTLTNVLTHHVPKNHVECAETMMVVLLVAVTMDMKVMDITAMTLMNAKIQMHAQKMQHAAIPTVVLSVNVILDILVTVILNVTILTNAKSLALTTVVNTPLVETLLVVLNVHVLTDTLVMVPNVQNLMTERFSTRVPVFGSALPDMLAQCTAVRMSMNAWIIHAAREPLAQTQAEASNANAEKASRVRHYLFSINYFYLIFSKQPLSQRPPPKPADPK